MKENYTNKELRELMEGVNLPDADKAWQKMSSLLDASAKSGGQTTVGHSLVFKTIIWLNSIFLVLTTVVVGAMYRNSSDSSLVQIEPEPKGQLTIHLPPFTGLNSSVAEEESGENDVPVVNGTNSSNTSSSTINQADQNAIGNVTVEEPLIENHSNTIVSSNDQVETGEEVETASSDKILGELVSPGVSINDKRSPVNDLEIKTGDEKLAPKTTNDTVLASAVSHDQKSVKDTAGDPFVDPNKIIPAPTQKPFWMAKAGVGINQHTPVAYFLRQMQFGVGYTIPLSARQGLQLELLYNPVAIDQYNWIEYIVVSYVPFKNDITARKLNYVSAPILLKHKLNSKWAMSFGVQQSYLLSKIGDVNSEVQTTGTALVSTYENIKPYSNEARFAEWNTAGLAEVEYRVERVVLSARLQHSLTDITRNLNGATGFDAFSNLTLSAGYLLGK